MPITASAKVLLDRLATFEKAMQDTGVPAESTRQIAHFTIDRVTENARSSLSGRTDQVGFDLTQFLANIRGPQRIRAAEYAILDTRKMGTLDDLEEIAFVSGLWHEHGQAFDSFRRLVFDKPDQRDRLAGWRQMIWGSKTPQWIFLENGTLDIPGINPGGPPANFIRNAKEPTALFAKWKQIIRERLSAAGVKLV